MLIALLQYDICWENPKENLSRLDALIAQTPHADLYLLPVFAEEHGAGGDSGADLHVG